MTTEQLWRLLHAKEGELEQRVLDENPKPLVELMADVSLLFSLFATYIEQTQRWDRQPLPPGREVVGKLGDEPLGMT